MPKILSDQDAQRMLSSSIVDYKGQLVMGGNVRDSVATFTDIETGERFEELADFDIIKNPNAGMLGYINQKYGCAYFTRTAARITRMGIGYDNVLCSATHSARSANVASRFTPSLFESLVKTYKNIFPSFEEAYESAIDNGVPRAFDRSFAVDRSGVLYFQGTAIGRANPRGEDFCEYNKVGKELKLIRHVPKLKWRTA